MRKIIFISTFFVFSLVSFANEKKLLNVGVNADLLLQADFENDDYQITPREAELILYSAADHIFDGHLSLAAHNEGGEYLFEIHEAYLFSSRLLDGFNFKLGQFFLGVGHLNRVHRHEWGFVDAPRYHVEFFSEEAAIDSGIEVEYLIPTDANLRLLGGLTSGYTFGHSHTAGERPNVPTNYLRFTKFFELGGGSGMEVGANYLFREAANDKQTLLLGLDFKYKQKRGKINRWLVQSEFWFRHTDTGIADDQALGFYAFPQYTWSNQISFGVRFDYYSILSLKNISGQNIDHMLLGIVPTVTWKVSEFVLLRLAYRFEEERSDSSRISRRNEIVFQANFTLGAHPAHDF